MAPNVLYTGCVLGAIAIYLLLRPRSSALKPVAVILGLGALGWAFRSSGAAATADRPNLFFYIFSVIAIASAVRMITHRRPVYAALYFVMVVLSSAALFLLLEAEFMAFAMIIVYAGAILITYLFVLMLAHQAPQPGEEESQPDYDVLPREPAAAVAVGFIMLALLTDTIFGGVGQLKPPPSPRQLQAESWQIVNMLPDRIELAARREIDGFESFAAGDPTVRLVGDTAYVDVIMTGSPEPVTVEAPLSALPENVERVGLALVAEFPVSLELAGVILLMAMYGAVIFARRQSEMSEAAS